MTKFDDFKENQSATTHLIWNLDSNSLKAAAILLYLSKTDGNSHIPSLYFTEIVAKT